MPSPLFWPFKEQLMKRLAERLRYERLRQQPPWQYALLAGVMVVLGIGLAQLLQWSQAVDDLGVKAERLPSPVLINEPIQPIPTEIPLNLAKVTLGEQLFHDRNLSSNRQMSCATCHQLEQGGMDGLPRAIGNDGQILATNTPTVWNSGFNFRQNWNGRSTSLEEQVEQVLLSPQEMNNSWAAVTEYLRRDRNYRRQFQQIYKGAPTAETVSDAIATFERSLTTPNSPFDRYLRGDRTAITATEKEGYARFKSYGCIACHQGVNVGGNMYQRLGTFEAYHPYQDQLTVDDLGRMAVTHRPRDRNVFKVPGLRNIEYTAPYLHDGSIDDLATMVKLMGRYQLGQKIPDTDIELIVKFLKTLSGQSFKQP